MFEVKEEDLDAAIELTREKHRVTLDRQRLIRIVNTIDVKRAYDRLKFPDALRYALTEHCVLRPEDRKHFKTALGKFFSERKKRLRKQKLERVPTERIPVGTQGRQYTFAEILPAGP